MAAVESAAPVLPQGARYRLFLPWVMFTLACLAAMWMYPGDEVVPFHLIWIAFALAYGFEPWPVPVTCVALAVATVSSGAILVTRASAGVIAWEETTEILLMALLACLVLWHVRRRLAATAAVTRLANHQVEAASQRERLARLTSHEMRTPLTLALGYVDLLLAREDRPDHREDLLVVRDELGRLVRAGDRLLRTIMLDDELPQDTLELPDLVEETVTRWSTVADRDWISDTTKASVVASRERLRACLDTIIENAVRYTEPGDTVRVFCHPNGPGAVCLGVADSGPGFTVEQAALINDDERATDGEHGLGIGPSGPNGQTGYGLGIVREIIASRNGTVRAERSPEGGALVRMVLPDGREGSSSRRWQPDRGSTGREAVADSSSTAQR